MMTIIIMFFLVSTDFFVDGALNRITFTPEDNEIAFCFNVTIVNDLALEDTEIFQLNIFTEDLSIILKNSLIVFEIQDDDGKLSER